MNLKRPLTNMLLVVALALPAKALASPVLEPAAPRADTPAIMVAQAQSVREMRENMQRRAEQNRAWRRQNEARWAADRERFDRHVAESRERSRRNRDRCCSGVSR